MKHVGLIFVLLCVLLAAVLVGCNIPGTAGQAPVVEGSVTGIVIAASGRDIMVQTQEDSAISLRSLRLADDLKQSFAVGDEVACTTQISAIGKETVVDARILSTDNAVAPAQGALTNPSDEKTS